MLVAKLQEIAFSHASFLALPNNINYHEINKKWPRKPLENKSNLINYIYFVQCNSLSVLCSGCRVLNVGDSPISKCISRKDRVNQFFFSKHLLLCQRSIATQLVALIAIGQYGKILSITPSLKIWPSPHEKAVSFIWALSEAYSLSPSLARRIHLPCKTFKAGLLYWIWPYSSLHQFFNTMNI